uniref:NmrA-like domain-containing protein n=1 Tax=Bornetia secundiflora TaxID=2575637 RepID=A0A4D6WLB6_9FLOR|nr:hypothetical protein [Bornetia secundiflora]
MSLLVFGSTGTLGRQIVRRALHEGFQVKCFVRNFRKASFLKEWGAELIYGDLAVPETIPQTLHGITAIIDASTTRTTDLYNTKQIDLYGKSILIQSAIKAKIHKYIFFSVLNAHKYSGIPLVELKLSIESQLLNSKINYTIFNLAGFFQGIVSQYAVPILDQQTIWLAGESTPIAYINTQDIAKIVVKSLSISQFNNKFYPIVGKKAWNSLEIVRLCEKISGQRAQIAQVPFYILKMIRLFTECFQWSWNISERLAFTEILSKGDLFDTSMYEVYNLLQLEEEDIESLEVYLQEYFEKIMNKLKEMNYHKLNSNTSDQQNNNF